MWITIMILAYVANVFLNRWLNKVAYKRNKIVPVMTLFWFCSLLATCVLLLIIVAVSEDKKISFTGKHW